MAGNTFGKAFRLTTFGESHGPAIGGVIDGCPAGLDIDKAYIQQWLDRRRPGQSSITTARQEEDQVHLLSGIFEGRTTGAPIGFLINNKDAVPKDYDPLKEVYRPSHADYTYQQKYGIRDHRGGGRASARETACRVVGGAIAAQLLAKQGLSIAAYVSSIGKVRLPKSYQDLDLNRRYENIVRCPDGMSTQAMVQAIQKAKEAGDSLGGTITCVIQHCPVGWGQPVFDRLEADLAKAMLSINATKGFEIGSGFDGTQHMGSEHNDQWNNEGGQMKTTTNNSGGVQGGISNGADIYFKVAFKPTATISQSQATVDKAGQATTVEGKGRHDPCVVPRAVPIVEAMAALTLADHSLRARMDRV